MAQRVTAANVGLAVRKVKDGKHVNRDTAINADDPSSADGMIVFAFATGVSWVLPRRGVTTAAAWLACAPTARCRHA